MRFLRKSKILLCIFCGALLFNQCQRPQDTETLEKELAAIDEKLEGTARLTLQSGVGNVGWFSNGQQNPDKPEWAEVHFPQHSQIEQVVLVPVLWNNATNGPTADGFPEAFRIIAGTKESPQGSVIAERDNKKTPFLPRVAPLVIDVPPTKASWIRIEATRLASHARNDLRRFKLSEIYLFSGEKNIALRNQVKTSSLVAGWGAAAISKEALVDGLTPYLMNSSTGKPSSPFIVGQKDKNAFHYVLDLGKLREIDGLRLYGADVNEYTPQLVPNSFGMPNQLTLVAAQSPEFSNPSPLLDYRSESFYQVDNLLAVNFAPTRCRYVSLLVPPEGWPREGNNQEALLALAEIEILHQGRNLAKGSKLMLQSAIDFRYSSRGAAASLTDGRNHYGKILPERAWMNQLALRHKLENQRPRVVQKIQRRYALQKARLNQMSWLVAFLVVAIVFIILIDRMIRLRTVVRLRERMTANLHDELSGSLHALGLLTDLARKNIHNPEKLDPMLQKIGRLSARNRHHAHHFMQLLQADAIVPDLESEMKRSADRLLTSYETELSFHGMEHTENISPRRRNDLVFFYQECLVNIVRHAGAQSVSITMECGPKKGTLQIGDDGKGTEQIPSSLQRRARILRGEVRLEKSEASGTTIILDFPIRKRILRSLAKRVL